MDATKRPWAPARGRFSSAAWDGRWGLALDLAPLLGCQIRRNTAERVIRSREGPYRCLQAVPSDKVVPINNDVIGGRPRVAGRLIEAHASGVTQGIREPVQMFGDRKELPLCPFPLIPCREVLIECRHGDRPLCSSRIMEHYPAGRGRLAGNLESARATCTPQGRCRIGWIVADSGRQEWEVRLDLRTGEGRLRKPRGTDATGG